MFSQLHRLNDAFAPPDCPPKKRESSVKRFSFLLDSNELLERFFNLPDADDIPFALDLKRIAQGQQNDKELWQRQMSHPIQYSKQQFGDTPVLSYQPIPNSP
jgi:hypothetical protein